MTDLSKLSNEELLKLAGINKNIENIITQPVAERQTLEINKIYQGDCLEIMKDIPDGSIDLILTDIPYQISKDNNFKTMKDRTGRIGIDFGEWDYNFKLSNLSILEKKLKVNGSFFTFHSFEQFHELQIIFTSLVFKDKIIWQKTNPMPRNRDRRYISDIEIASWYTKKDSKWVFNRQDDKYEKSVFRFPSESGGGFKRFHPTQKNLNLIEYLIKIHSNEGDIVLDPFAGSGTTGVACQNLKRNYILIEKEEKYCKIIKERLGIKEENLCQENKQTNLV